ncbi:uncharacterized protein LOC133792144 [Humulus lupulus]|uniref:uncharacterized protein LOC133792144 n=1 Tax=Humulus lupulus TaxID=3486 RepID=UPI002B405B8E|nr:uncharacterized protein LOC133792144 [Humulus lupulus]
MNNSILPLIPKVENPSRALDFKSIVCCNTIYKCISKMICSRLANVPLMLVNQNQGVVIKNSTIAHNILIFQDLIKGYNRKNSSPRCVMKIDLRKAYDKIDWHFLEDLLKAFHFPSRFIHWIMVCLKGTSYSFMMNVGCKGVLMGKRSQTRRSYLPFAICVSHGIPQDFSFKLLTIRISDFIPCAKG